MHLTCLLHSTLFYLLILSFTKCRANFEKQIDLENHIASAHEGRKQNTCNKCSATFANHTPLINHIASVHEGKKQHECNNCSATFDDFFDLEYHITCICS